MFFLNTETLNLMIKGRRSELHLILCTRKDEIRFIFKQYRFISDSGRKMPYLGRTWREFAEAAFVGCESLQGRSIPGEMKIIKNDGFQTGSFKLIQKR